MLYIPPYVTARYWNIWNVQNLYSMRTWKVFQSKNRWWIKWYNKFKGVLWNWMYCIIFHICACLFVFGTVQVLAFSYGLSDAMNQIQTPVRKSHLLVSNRKNAQSTDLHKTQAKCLLLTEGMFVAEVVEWHSKISVRHFSKSFSKHMKLLCRAVV